MGGGFPREDLGKDLQMPRERDKGRDREGGVWGVSGLLRVEGRGRGSNVMGCAVRSDYLTVAGIIRL